ncbi:MAG: KUP/HAK/KT family potassium transporter [Oscillospiraceae bacterium]|nr:KUP/HAK/KT family potassium transporter [Oscillospiraceae bacterium]
MAVGKQQDKKKRFRFAMFLVTIGIVYGDIGTSPLYVMKSIMEGNGGISGVDEHFIIGSLSLVIWTITLLTTVKYVLIAMKADNHGEGGIFSLYALVKSCGKWLIVPAMLGGAALLADGVLTPAVTVTTAVEGLRSIESMNRFLGSGQLKVVIITLAIITTLFSVQHAGTSKIGKAFGPAMLLWFSFLGLTGAAHVFSAPAVLKAFNPYYAIWLLFSPANKLGFMILGSVFLATTGAEALYSDMGHVGKENIYFSWPFVKICLILNYLGQGAWIIQSRGNSALYAIEDLNPFFMMLPEMLRPVAVILSALAAVIASQALITGSYTLVSEAILLDLLPHLEIRYPSDTKGQLYIGTVNSVLWIGCSLVVLYFRSGARIESAYGLAITVTMLMTTLLLWVYLFSIRKRKLLSFVILLVFGGIESIFFISSLGKFMHGGYVTVILTLLLLFLEIVWYRGTQLEKQYCTRLKVRDHVDSLIALHNDEEIPMLAHNLVYLGSEKDPELIDRDVLYSILDKDTKRAMAYWFVSVNVLNDPKAMTYELETYGTDCIFRIRLNLGFKCPTRINVYLRQIVQDMQKRGELPDQNKKYSIYGQSNVGTFKFCIIHKSVTPKTELSSTDEFILNTKYSIRKMAGSKVKWYGLDTSSLILENVPLITGGSSNSDVIQRVSEHGWTDATELHAEE